MGSPKAGSAQLHHSPLPTDLAGEGLLIGVGQHVPAQVLLVLGGKAAVGALVWPEVGMLNHVALGQKDKCWVRNPRFSKPLVPRAALHQETYPDFWPECGSEGTVGTLESAGPNVGSLVTLHLRSPCEHGCANLA